MCCRMISSVSCSPRHPPADPPAGPVDDPAGCGAGAGRYRAHDARAGGGRPAGMNRLLLLARCCTASFSSAWRPSTVRCWRWRCLSHSTWQPRSSTRLRPAPHRQPRPVRRARVQPGGTVDVCLHITNAGSYLEEVLVEDVLPAGVEVTEGKPATSSTCRPARPWNWYTRWLRRAASYQFERVAATAGDHLGLFRRQIRVAAPGSFTVLPELRRMPQVAIRPRRTRQCRGRRPRLGGPGPRSSACASISRATRSAGSTGAPARHPLHLFTNEFEQERAADVGLILDARVRSDIQARGVALFEHAVTTPLRPWPMPSCAGQPRGAARVWRRHRMGLSGLRLASSASASCRRWAGPAAGPAMCSRPSSRCRHGSSPAVAGIVMVSPLWTEGLPMLFTLRASV